MDKYLQKPPEAFVAHDLEQITSSMSSLLDPNHTVRFEETIPAKPLKASKANRSRQLGKPGVRLYVIKQAEEGLAQVFAFAKEEPA